MVMMAEPNNREAANRIEEEKEEERPKIEVVVVMVMLFTGKVHRIELRSDCPLTDVGAACFRQHVQCGNKGQLWDYWRAVRFYTGPNVKMHRLIPLHVSVGELQTKMLFERLLPWTQEDMMRFDSKRFIFIEQMPESMRVILASHVSCPRTCGHAFDPDCIRDWWDKKETKCPLCFTPFGACFRDWLDYGAPAPTPCQRASCGVVGGHKN